MNELVQFVVSAKDATGAAFSSARAGLNRLGEQVISVRGLVATLTASFSVGAFAAGVKGASESADAAAKMGDRFGIATEKMIGMQHAGRLAGASNEAVAAGLKSMASLAIEAARGGDEAQRALRELGINAQAFVKLPMDAQLALIIDRLHGVENATLRNELANKVLGKSYGELMGLVADGSAAFRQATEEARAWGLAISRVDAAKLELANDALTRARAAAQGLFTTIAVQVAPIVKALADLWADNKREANGYRQEVSYALEKTIVGVAYATNVVRGLEFAYQTVKFGVATMGEITFKVLEFIVDKLRMIGTVASYLPGPLGVVGQAVKQFADPAPFGEMARSMGNVAEEIREKMDELAARGLVDPDKLVEKVRALSRTLEEEAKKVAAARAKFAATGDVEIGEDKTKPRPIDTGRERIKARLAQMHEDEVTEQDFLKERLRERNELLQEGLEYGLITEAEAARMSEGIQLHHNAKMGDLVAQGMLQRRTIEQMGLRQQTEFYFGTLANVTASAAQHNRKMFELNKIANIANAIMSTYTGATKALEWGFPMGPIFAGIIIAAGLANVRAIAAQQFQGGAATAPASPTFSANPNTGLPAAQSAPTQNQTTILNVPSGRRLFTLDDIRDLFELMNQAALKGGRLNSVIIRQS